MQATVMQASAVLTQSSALIVAILLGASSAAESSAVPVAV